jgi:hypothetical protein
VSHSLSVIRPAVSFSNVDSRVGQWSSGRGVRPAPRTHAIASIHSLTVRFGSLGAAALSAAYRWTRKYGGHQVNEARHPKALEEENRRLKRPVDE